MSLQFLGKIIILDDETIKQIAAGEVIERPVSLVKELVGNSLDAGATRIIIEIEKGGLASISVIDNGCGMNEFDVEMSFHPHATSKIQSAVDLSRISTLGFRGEALPSIAAVSRLTVQTCLQEATTGRQLELEGGKIVASRPVGCPPGTAITVKDLFFNTPARRKYLKSEATEGGLIGYQVERLALAWPEVAFQFKHNGRLVFQSTGSGRLLDVVALVYGIEQAKEMLEINFKASDRLSLYGFASKPSLNRSSRRYQTFFVNRRYVRASLLAEAVGEAYRTLLPTGRYPVVVLGITMDCVQVDINVHPSKMKVRFRKEMELMDLITNTLRETLQKHSLIPTVGRILKQKALNKWPASFQESFEYGETYSINDPVKQKEEGTGFFLPAKGRFPVMKLLAQLLPTYILAQGEEGLFVIDQHAAHERVLYEEYLVTVSNKKAKSQYLFTPVPLELSHAEFLVLDQHLSLFYELGFLLEHFGGDSFLLRGVPQGFPDGKEFTFFLDTIDYLMEKGRSAERRLLLDNLIASLACHSSIKAGERLTIPAMEALVKRLANTENPFSCPHGRPTIIQLLYSQLEFWFKRT